jgi:hypothetical protein
MNSLRQLNPKLVALAVAVLALGLSANTVLFSIGLAASCLCPIQNPSCSSGQ